VGIAPCSIGAVGILLATRVDAKSGRRAFFGLQTGATDATASVFSAGFILTVWRASRWIDFALSRDGTDFVGTAGAAGAPTAVVSTILVFALCDTGDRTDTIACTSLANGAHSTGATASIVAAFATGAIRRTVGRALSIHASLVVGADTAERAASIEATIAVGTVGRADTVLALSGWLTGRVLWTRAASPPTTIITTKTTGAVGNASNGVLLIVGLTDRIARGGDFTGQ